MKKLPFIVFFFFLFGMSYGQKKAIDTSALGHIIYGTGISKNVKLLFVSFDSSPRIIKHSDGRLEIYGDSLSAIRLLIKEMERMDSVHNEEINWHQKKYMKLVHAVLADQRDKQKIWNDFENSLKKIK